jgi:voltage-gated potassium channel Kch
VIKRLSIGNALYVSTVIFTTLGFSDMTRATQVGKLLIAAEVIIGYVMLGALLAILANKLARLA